MLTGAEQEYSPAEERGGDGGVELEHLQALVGVDGEVPPSVFAIGLIQFQTVHVRSPSLRGVYSGWRRRGAKPFHRIVPVVGPVPEGEESGVGRVFGQDSGEVVTPLRGDVVGGAPRPRRPFEEIAVAVENHHAVLITTSAPSARKGRITTSVTNA